MKISCAVPFQVAQQNHYATLSIDVTNRLVQGWDGHVVNDWEATENVGKQPILKPSITVGGGFSLTDQTVSWYRINHAGDTEELIGTVQINNGSPLELTGYTISRVTGEMRITKNLASETNQDPDTFICKVTGNINGAPLARPLTRAVQLMILPVGADGYLVVIEAANIGGTQYRTALNSTHTFTWLKCSAIDTNGNDVTSDITYTWKKGGAAWTPTATNGVNTVKVTRDEVDWQEVFTCEVSIAGKNAGTAAIVITDQADDYKVEGQLTGELGASGASSAVLSWQIYKDSITGDDIGEWQVFAPTAEAKVYVVGLPAAIATINMTSSDNGKGTLAVNTGMFSADASNAALAGGIVAGNFRIEITW